MQSRFGNFFSVTNLARITFLVYLFFIFFGTTIPFGERASDIEDVATSNPAKQLIFSAVYLLAFIAIIPKWRSVLDIIRREKYLSLFVLWAFLSFVWSEYPAITFKRWIQFAGTFIVILMAASHLISTKEIFKYIRAILLLYITITFISVLIIPGASQMYHGEYVFRGLSPHKNQLGQSVLISVIIFSYAIKNYKSRFAIIDPLMLVISIFLLLGSRSSTSIITCFILGIIVFVTFLNYRIGNLGVGKWLLYVVIISIILLFTTVAYAYPVFLEQVFAYLEKDPSFTGRTDLWKDLIELQGDRILLGSGYGAFWVLESIKMYFLYMTYIWLPRQAHNGYLDVLLDNGIIGFSLLIMIISSFFYRYFKNFVISDKIWLYIILASLVLNFQESSIFSGTSVMGVMFVFAYIFKVPQIRSKKE